MRYRSDIDGLRAVAVLPVLLFHAGLPGVTGGFVGVDVFFVISGFLISGILNEEMETGRYSLINFYERRARRLFPALFTVVAAVLVVGALIMLPKDLAAMAKSAVATLAFVSNISFWQETGYFAAASELKPLLHTWSLAVEEQFYIVFPLLLLLLRWLKLVRIGLVVGALLSLALCIWGTKHVPAAAFFLAPARAWELLLGALISLTPALRARGRWAEVASVAGLAMILGSVVLFSPLTAFPGAAALVPCIGAALILASEGGRVSAVVLGSRPAVFIGKISYSLYLWHWPVLAFVRYWLGDVTPPAAAAALILSGLLATATWLWIENPVRVRKALTTRRMLFVGSGVAAALLGAAGLLLMGGLPNRFSPEVLAMADGTRLRLSRHCIDNSPTCQIGAEAPPRVVIWGDSHSWAMRETLGRALAAEGLSATTLHRSGCPPLLGVIRVGHPVNCSRLAAAGLDQIRSMTGVSTVILVGNWGKYVSTPEGQPGEFVVVSDGHPGDVVGRGLTRSIGALRESGLKIIVVDTAPGAREDVPRAIALRMAFGWSHPLTYSREEYLRINAPFSATMDRLKPDGRIQPWRTLCQTGVCVVEENGRPLYFDDDHVAPSALDFTIPDIRRVLRETTPPGKGAGPTAAAAPTAR